MMAEVGHHVMPRPEGGSVPEDDGSSVDGEPLREVPVPEQHQRQLCLQVLLDKPSINGRFFPTIEGFVEYAKGYIVRMVSLTVQEHGHTRLLGAIYSSRGPVTVTGILRRLGEQRKLDHVPFLYVFQHDLPDQPDRQHIHVYHICKYSNHSCRCPWKEETENQRIGHRRLLYPNVYAGSVTEDDWGNILYYSFLDGRLPVYGQMYGCFWGLPPQPEVLQLYRNSSGGPRGLVETRGASLIRSCQEGLPDTSTAGRKRSHSDVTVIFDDFKKTIRKKLMQILASPLQDAIHSQAWLDDKQLRFVRDNNRQFKDVLDSVESLMQKYSVRDFIDMYNAKDCNPVFMESWGPYYTRKESFAICKELLMYQLGTYEDCSEFVLVLYQILNRSFPNRMCNCFILQGPTNCGKTIFMEMVASFFISKGGIVSFNPKGQLEFQDCYNKRVILWDGPRRSYGSKTMETLKCLTAGDPVPVKRNSHKMISQTPLIITTESVISIMHDIAFVDRIRKYHWDTAPLLKKYNKLLHPLAFIDVLHYYTDVLA
nr:MAG: non-structural protein NS1 [Millipede denso-like virus]